MHLNRVCVCVCVCVVFVLVHSLYLQVLDVLEWDEGCWVNLVEFVVGKIPVNTVSITY